LDFEEGTAEVRRRRRRALIGCGSLDGGEEVSRSGPWLVLLGTGWDGGEAEGEGDSECLHHLLPNLWVFCKH
jgi:hypothetical protein